ncbi:MAG: SoxR reducing system RseC family protein [Clostridia bacterium]|nr:SoxR reducing system RseC family protein [Clostridia bacterium]
MAMMQTGYVAKIESGTVKIRVMRESACGGNCASCHGCPSGTVFVTGNDNPADPFVIGEEVLIEMPSKKFFSGMFGSYGVMALGMLLGASAGYGLTDTEGFSVLGAFLGLAVGAVLMRLLSKKREDGIRIIRQKERG